MKKMGGLSSIMGMMPGLGLGGGKMPEIDTDEDDEKKSAENGSNYSFHDTAGT